MDETILYDLICDKTIDKWREEIEKEDCNIKKNMLQQKDLLYAAVDESNRVLVDRYGLAVENFLDYLYLCVNIKLINTCIKIGMELQKFFDKTDEYKRPAAKIRRGALVCNFKQVFGHRRCFR